MSTARLIDQTYVNNGQVRVVSRNLPVHGEQAVKMAEAALCASDQGKYWEYHDSLLESLYVGNVASLGLPGLRERAPGLGLDSAAFGSCLESGRHIPRIQAEASEAGKLGIDGTPAFVVNGKLIVGAQPWATFRTAIDDALRQ